MKYLISERQHNLIIEELLNEGPIPPSLMKLFGAQTARKLEQIFAQDIDNIETFFARIIAADEKVLLTKGGQQYFKSSMGVDVPASTLKSMIDLATVGKITKSNLDQYMTLLPEKFYNGSDFRNNIRNLLIATINRAEKAAASKTVGAVPAKNLTTQTAASPNAIAKSLSNTKFRVADSDESFKIAGWLDQKFYESGMRRIAKPTEAEYAKMTPETKSYLIQLLDYMKNDHINYVNGKWIVPENNLPSVTERDFVNNAVVNMWGGLGRPGDFVRNFIYNKTPVPKLLAPSKAVEDNLNSIYPTPKNSQYGEKNFWSSSQ